MTHTPQTPDAATDLLEVHGAFVGELEDVGKELARIGSERRSLAARNGAKFDGQAREDSRRLDALARPFWEKEAEIRRRYGLWLAGDDLQARVKPDYLQQMVQLNTLRLEELVVLMARSQGR